MLKEIITEVENILNDSIKRIAHEDYLSFILFIGRADVDSGLKERQGTGCVIDYQLDRYYDETRDAFYLHYLNRNYNREGFHYEGESGIDDLSIEMMIYCHMWDSLYFLKSLYRLSSILCGNGYLWDVENVKKPKNRAYEDVKGKYEVVKDNIINPLKEKGLQLGDLIEKSYNSIFRNAFAHSLYNINVESREIYTRTKEGPMTYSFEDFQCCFLNSAILMNRLQNVLEQNHINFAKTSTILTDPFETPDGILVYVKGVMVERGGELFPEFRLVKVVKDE